MCKPNLPLTICSNVEELGGGTNTMFNYTPRYANGKEPVIEEQDVYRIEIPYVPSLQGSDIDTTQKTTQKSTLISTLKGTRKAIVGIIMDTPSVTPTCRGCSQRYSKIGW